MQYTRYPSENFSLFPSKPPIQILSAVSSQSPGVNEFISIVFRLGKYKCPWYYYVLLACEGFLEKESNYIL